MNEKLIHDATKTITPIFYQCYIALKKCFDLMEDERVYIEKYGDVTRLGGNRNSQTEVKDYQEPLTDLSHNIWKTLKNWLNDPNIINYKNLILLTTQNYSITSSFKEWNNKNKDEKLLILKKIESSFLKQKIHRKATQELLEYVLDNSKNKKLLEILDKFIISSSELSDIELYKKLTQTKTHGVPIAKKEEYIDALMGYIIKPSVTSNDWEITYQSFQGKTKSLLEEYNSKTIIFPSTHVNIKTTLEEEGKFIDSTFVKKIDVIGYSKIKGEAISDYIYTSKIVLEELSRYEIDPKQYEYYQNEIYSTYETKYRTASLKTDKDNLIKNSKIFYNDITGAESPNFINFNNTPKKFKNGFLHIMANDDNGEKEREIKWKLEGDDNE